jgi:putative MATE family efflux protein
MGRLTQLFGDRAFFAALVKIALPITIQQLALSLLNATDVLLIGQLGETAVAAVGLANQIFFLLNLLLFGIISGSAIFTAQFWGRRDLAGIRQVLGISLLLAVTGGLGFTLLAVLAPEWALRIYTSDVAVIAQGAPYLRVVGLSYVVTAITYAYSAVLRSTEHVRLPTVVSVTALSLKTVLGYLLIFGHFGLPQMGVVGAAVATCVARYGECAALLALTYIRRTPAAAHPRELLGADRAFVRRFLITTSPVVLEEIVWSLGITTYYAIYARIGTDSVAAINIAAAIEGLVFVTFIGLGNSAAIMIGNRIGAEELAQAGEYAGRFLRLAIAVGVVAGGLVLAGSSLVLGLYKITPETRAVAQAVLTVMAFVLWAKASNMVMIVGIMRSGADTRFALVADIAPLWLIGIPLALTGAFILHLPTHLVYVLVMCDELSKFFISAWRVRSGRWIHRVA